MCRRPCARVCWRWKIERFYQHWGFSLAGIARAALSNLRSGRVVAGGSTITQQLVKNYYLTPERTIARKLTEVLMAVLLELHYEKDQILESYINEVYLGQEGPRSIHGFALAARHYFDTPLEQLGLHQQALLIGMIKGPSLYNPVRNPERALERRNVVLDVMAEQGVISSEHATVARAMPLGLNNKRQRARFLSGLPGPGASAVAPGLSRRRPDHAGPEYFYQFRPAAAAPAGAQHHRDYGSAGSRRANWKVPRWLRASIPVRWRRLVGGRKPRYAGFNRALDARRPAGSLLKPAIYLAALEQPRSYTLATPSVGYPDEGRAAGGRTLGAAQF